MVDRTFLVLIGGRDSILKMLKHLGVFWGETNFFAIIVVLYPGGTFLI
jgi:hypothetical protein